MGLLTPTPASGSADIYAYIISLPMGYSQELVKTRRI